MTVPVVPWRSGVATDAGRLREENQDRSFADDERGIFLVVDGVGGRAAGGKAADTAVTAIVAELASSEDGVPERIRRAIARANNEIRSAAEIDAACEGMACVLTLAVLDNGRMTVGHVGDSRLYLVWNGTLRKLTPDHSPVGEREDRGELSEEEAMLHPRRHEVFRDVGSRYRDAQDGEFIELREFLFRPEAAVLLCSDGLSDMLTSAGMREIIERYDGDPQRTARELVEAANEAGGCDNVTAVFVAGADFLGHASGAMVEARSRHAVTRPRAGPRFSQRLHRALTTPAAFIAYGFVLGILIALTALKLR